MAKKKSSGRAAKTASSTKARVELRMERELFEKMTAIAEGAEISLNQLMNGLAEWASRYAIQGEPVMKVEDGTEVVERKDQPGCVFFGRVFKRDHVFVGTQEEFEAMDDGWIPSARDEDRMYELRITDPGAVHCALDFTVRRVVKEE
jgi:hypothetical protein